MKPVAGIALALLLVAGPVAASCTARSGPQRVPLLELYTSEGCSSCPPADRWASTLPALALDATRVVTLAYHVDYWNDLGWEDPFAQARYTERQRFANARIGNRVIFTPQFMLDGRDYRAWRVRDDLRQRVASAHLEPPSADIVLALDAGDTTLATVTQIALHDAGPVADVGLFVALYENDLTHQVTAGENSDRRLAHDFVVRALAGPFAVGSGPIRHTFALQPDWKTRDLVVAAFVQSAARGEVLQAIALPWCD